MVAAFVVTLAVFPHVLSFARKHKLVDNPDARKLQREPVPLMGGVTVFIGLTVSVLAGYFLLWDIRLLKILAVLLVMLLIGVWDDMKDVSASLRFVLEVLVVWFMIPFLGMHINDFHGLWGFHELPMVASVPLSIIAGVGIMNAINMIDGVDGYCSTFGIMASTVFAVVFYRAGDMAMFLLALVAIGALIPFMFHNVFGEKSKMFLGDGGSLMLGTLLVVFTFRTLSSGFPGQAFDASGLLLPALMLATLAVPVFDTLKVMCFRMFRGGSPFHPDKTHLHHLFIEMQFSHLFTSGVIVLSNALMVCLLLLAWRLGASIDWQFYLVVLMALLLTWGFYFFMEHEGRKNDGQGSEFYQRLSLLARRHYFTISAIWLFLRRLVDSHLLAGDEKE